MGLLLTSASTGVARDAHYVTPTGATTAIRTLLLEPQRTNLCIRSEEFDTWSVIGSSSVTTTHSAPDGATTADLITCTAAGPASAGRSRDVTFTGDGEKCVSVFLKVGNGSVSTIALFDTTASTMRHQVRVTWTSGVPSLSTIAGSGTLYPVEPIADGWYRISFSAASVIAANTNNVRIYVNNVGSAVTGDSVYAWGAQAEDAIVPSSYISTTSTTVTRQADSLYFDVPALNPPREMTVYVRGVEMGHRLEPSSYILQVSQTNNNPRLNLNRTTGTAQAQWQSVNTAGVFSTVGATANTSVFDLTEYRGVLAANGALTLGTTLNGGTEANASTAGTALESAWAGTRLSVGSSTAGANSGLFGFTHVCVATGVQTRDTMRALAGVD